MDVSSLTSAYSDYYSQLASNADASSVSKKLNAAEAAAASDEELMEACKEFESYLLEQVFKKMQDTTKLFSDDEDDSNSQLVDYFSDLTIQEISSQASDQNSIGLAQMLYDQMKINQNAISPEALAQNAAEQGATASAEE